MSRSDSRRLPLLAVIAMMTAITASTAIAVLSGASDPEIIWQTINGGGGTSSGGDYALSGTIGQSDAGTMSGAAFTLTGGFWTGAANASTPPCPADIDGSGTVDLSDLLIVLAAWGSCADPQACPADLTGDGQVDLSDLLGVLAAWGACPE